MGDEIQNGQYNGQEHGTIHLSGMYKDYFLDYASYVILERAVPLLFDGLKPVQRRILHAMKEMDDGRFHKVANIIGQTMQYHPHGDAAIGDALVNLGQKDLLIDTQGNWGDVRTGDSAAAPRYIEARLSKFALDVSFNAKITEWQASYDGRKKEPIALPVKFPLVLAQGVDGIAVGLSTKILPHNFIELVKASIAVLKGKKVELFPDFPNGGMIDVSGYNGGKRGGKIRCRAHIEIQDKSTLLVKDIPYGTTTSTLIESIVKANEKGKIKIKKVVDNTAKNVEVQIDLPPGVSPDVTIDALYAFSDCEVSISPNACVIIDETPVFLTVEELLRLSTDNTLDILRRELEIRLADLRERLLFSSLEKIFIENRIYRDIEECETWEAVLQTIDKGLDPYKPQFYREINEEDILRLTEIRIKRISKFNSFKADELMRELEKEIAEVEHHLIHLTEFAISYFEDLLAKYGKGRERVSEIMTFDNIEVRQVAVANEKLYINRKEGFAGYGLKKDEYICDCSDIDDIIVFRADGKFIVTRAQEKAFVGKNIIHADVWQKGNERKIYHAIYRDPDSGKNFVKRFAVTAITRDREYDVTNGAEGSKLLYFEAHPNSEAEVVTVQLTPNCRAKIKTFDFDFGELAIKGRSSQGNVLTKYPIRKITQKEIGAATLGGRKIWYDETVGRLNVDGRGEYLGEFDTDDSVLVIHKDGSYEMTNFELTNRYDINKTQIVEKFDPSTVISTVYYDPKQKDYFVKRFRIETTTLDKKFTFIGEEAGSKMLVVSTHPEPRIKYYTTGTKGNAKEETEISLAEFIDVKGWRTIGNRLDRRKVTSVKELPPLEPEDDEEEIPDKLKTGDQIEWSKDDLKNQQGKLF
ncbi:MAG: DNA gyrase/topoisomerase IV subunit A [Bacteroidia bacterium]|nr:DNA gyrase/topoisomerase IV subunit A [Bacteroidia bacterium]